MTLGELRSYKLGRRSLYNSTPMSTKLTRGDIVKQRDVNYNKEVLLATDGNTVKTMAEVVNTQSDDMCNDITIVKTRELYRTSNLKPSDITVSKMKTRRIINTVDSIEFSKYYHDTMRMTDREDGCVYEEIEVVEKSRVTDKINGILRVPKVVSKDYSSKIV